ncbi:hypothetical protein GCM10010404_85160 [Nonomuraea africana]|uniref:Uncharacterized protein n=1 Tax=Nonomuraea africana TaxID=46171 RepID=A0ABR9KEK3_9ACTN|nr:hypothetical protein [Nonomuraea africana]
MGAPQRVEGGAQGGRRVVVGSTAKTLTSLSPLTQWRSVLGSTKTTIMAGLAMDQSTAALTVSTSGRWAATSLQVSPSSREP